MQEYSSTFEGTPGPNEGIDCSEMPLNASAHPLERGLGIYHLCSHLKEKELLFPYPMAVLIIYIIERSLFVAFRCLVAAPGVLRHERSRLGEVQGQQPPIQ
jgi:hypothetical protein